MRTARRHDENHLQFIRGLPCIRCLNDTATEAAHLRRADARIAKPITGIGIKPDDRFVLPLCGKDHRRQHAIGEKNFWVNCDPELWALALYSISGDQETGEKIVHAAALWSD
jgi:hypothetical protein